MPAHSAGEGVVSFSRCAGAIILSLVEFFLVESDIERQAFCRCQSILQKFLFGITNDVAIVPHC